MPPDSFDGGSTAGVDSGRGSARLGAGCCVEKKNALHVSCWVGFGQGGDQFEHGVGWVFDRGEPIRTPAFGGGPTEKPLPLRFRSRPRSLFEFGSF